MSELASGLASAANATPAPASTPEPSAPASTPAAPSAPSSLADHFKALDPAPAPAPTDPPASSGDVPAIEAPQANQEAIGEAPKGPIPFDVHKNALQNAREKERTETEQRLQQQWQQELEPVKAVLPVANAIAQDVATGSLNGLNQLLGEYAQHPTLGPQLRSMFGRMLSQQRGQQQQAQPEAAPEADLQMQDGTLVYSAQQLAKWQEWNAKRMKAEIGQEFAPLRDLQQQLAKVQETQQQTQAYVQQATPLVEELQAMPGFADFKAEIAAKQAELFEAAHRSGQRVDPVKLWFKAYREVVPNKLQAKAVQEQQQQQQQLAASALAKAAGRDANLATVVGNPSPTPKSLIEAFAQQGLR